MKEFVLSDDASVIKLNIGYKVELNEKRYVVVSGQTDRCWYRKKQPSQFFIARASVWSSAFYRLVGVDRIRSCLGHEFVHSVDG